MSKLRLLNGCLGKEGGVERFLVNLTQAFYRRGKIEQRCNIRPDRLWRRQIVEIGPLIENNHRLLPLTRSWPWGAYRRLLKGRKPGVVFAYEPHAARFQQNLEEGLEVERLGDFPAIINHLRDSDVIVCDTPAITDHVKSLGWTKLAKTITNFSRPIKAQLIGRRDGVAGMLFEIDDLEEMVAGLRSLQDGESLRQRFGAAGRERLVTFFSEHAIVGAYLAAFRGELHQ